MAGSVRELPLRHAMILGLLHGPTELLPISSSAHTTLVPWLAGWPYGQLDPRLRKSFEVALHAGTAAALLLRPPSGPTRGRDPDDLPATDSTGSSRKRVGAKLGFMAAGLTPPALAGYALGEQIERRLGTPAKIAAGLLAGATAMGAAEARAKWRFPAPSGGASAFAEDRSPTQAAAARPAASADMHDGLALGLAQALALIPGVSRSGATFAAARARGFSRLEADQLSWTVGLPVIAGATFLQGARQVRAGTRACGVGRGNMTNAARGNDGASRAASLPLTVGVTSAFLSTLACSKLLDRRRRTQLLPVCLAYRGALTAVVIRRMRDNTT
jgi:undecaprenyl-diphosphatase